MVPTATFSLGYARKTRSPSLYERYTWGRGHMAAAVNNWFCDANGYLGNPDLDPEVAHTASISGDFHDAGGDTWKLEATPYVSYVEDFIDTDPTNETFRPGGQFVRLRFANHDALLYGVDLSGSLALARSATLGDFDLVGVAGFVRGENLDTDDNLYHMVPLNLRLPLNHRLGDWSNGIELVASATKDELNAARREPETSAYALINLKTAYEWPGIRVDAGADNLFDQRYCEPLGGVDFADFKIEGGVIGPRPLFQHRSHADLLTTEAAVESSRRRPCRRSRQTWHTTTNSGARAMQVSGHSPYGGRGLEGMSNSALPG